MKINKLIKHVFAVTLIAFASFALPKVANAANYYVSSSGSDSNSGTLSSPFKTIQKGVNTVNAGGTLLVRGGTYVEAVRITRSGTAGNPITIRNYQNETPVIDGKAGVNCLNCGLPSGSIAKTDPRTGRGFNYSPLVGIEGNLIIFDGFVVKRSLGVGIRVWRGDSRASNVTLRNNQVLDSRHVGIFLQTTENILIENNVVWQAGSYAPWVDGRGSSVVWPVALSVKNTSNTIVRGNTVYENWTEGISLIGNITDIIIEDNIVYDNFAVQIYVGGKDNVTVQRNLTYHTNDPNWRRGGNPSGCIVLAEEQSIGNIANNYDIINNVAVGCVQNFSAWASAGLPLKNTLIAHNTFINAVTNNSSRPAQNVSLSDNNSVVRFENNIIYQGNTSGGNNVGRGGSGVSYANNLWYPTRASNSSGSEDIVGQDPMFSDSRAYQLPQNWNTAPKREWFKVISGSPVINAGKKSTAFLATTDITKDMFLVNRDNNPDIGIHEYSGSASPTTATPTMPSTTPTQSPPTATSPPVPFTGDANGDGTVDDADYDIWFENYDTTTTSGASVGDFNEDSAVDGVDYAIWVTSYEHATPTQSPPTATSPPVPFTGDANGDGTVDDADYDIWFENYDTTTTSGASVGDFNEDSAVDGVDYAIWVSSYSDTIPPPPPPPSGNTTKWNPGHYLNFRYHDPSLISKLESLSDYKYRNIKGVEIKTYWGQIEGNTPGSYKFAQIDEMLNAIPDDMNLFIRFLDRDFGRTCDKTGQIPGYIKNHAQYPALNFDGGVGCIAQVWKAPIMDHEINLFKALLSKYDSNPKFGGTTIGETAIGRVDGNFSNTELFTQLTRFHTIMSPYFAKSIKFQSMNWFGGSHRCDRLRQLADTIIETGGGIYNPDNPPWRAKPEPGDDCTAYFPTPLDGFTDIPVYHIFRDYKGKVVIAPGPDTSQYGDPTNPRTFNGELMTMPNLVEAIYKMETDGFMQDGTFVEGFGANYIFWNIGFWSIDAGSLPGWEDAVLNFINQGYGTDTTCPSNINC